ncbi:hypothetical protein [Leucobacter chromiiresistens]|nr:hypothetical protein [Leucobacter chromiiresistens]
MALEGVDEDAEAALTVWVPSPMVVPWVSVMCTTVLARVMR